MRSIPVILVSCVVVLSAAVVVGCGGSSSDKAGGKTPVKPVELVLADDDDGGEHVKPWIDEVNQLSSGTLRIRIADRWREGEADYEAGMLEDVRSGKVDLAKVPARAYDEAGVTSLQPLQAPLLIDSRALERQVLRDVVGREALAGVEKLGVIGLALFPSELRLPVGVSRPLVGPDDYRGARIYARAGKVAHSTLRALGARPVRRPRADWHQSVDGAELGFSGVTRDARVGRRVTITSNVVLWPQPLTIVIGRERYDELSPAHQDVLRRAATKAFATLDRELTEIGDERVTYACHIGTTFVRATPQQIAGLRRAVQPVYDDIARAPGGRAALARIQELKGDAESEAAACARDNAAPRPPSGEPRLEGTFRMSLSEKELAASPLVGGAELNDQNWGDLTLRLSNGRVRYTQRNARDSFEDGGPYTIDGDVITMEMEGLGETWGFRWSEYRGRLRFKRDDSLGVPPELFAPTPFVIKAWRRVR